MKRRKFLQTAGFGCLGILLSGCGEEQPDPALDYPPPDEWMDPGPLHSAFTEVNGLRMHALVSEEAGRDAAAMVLVHGSGLSGQYMIPTARELSADFRVYVPDIPGYGDSGDPGKILNVEEMADWLAAWMQAAGVQRAALLGNSFGCQVIADLAARYPQHVSHALLQGPTTPPSERSAFWQFVRWRQNQAHIPGWLSEYTDEDYEKAGYPRLVRSFIYQITDRIEEKMPLIQAPVQIILGALDPIVHRTFCEELVRLAPYGELYIIPDVAHTLVFTAPEPLAEAARHFVFSHPDQGGLSL